MTVFLNQVHSDISYHLERQEFDGPLDLLLTLIKDAKLDIKDIFISDITNQYLGYIQKMTKLDYDYCAEFLSVASTLLEIKSKSLLPKMEFNDEYVEDPYSEEEKLIYRIEEYKLFKEASIKLADTETLHRFYRAPQFTEDDYRVVIKTFNLSKLINAFSLLLERVEFYENDDEPKTILKERFTVSDKVLYLITMIREYKQIEFFDLFEKDFSKIEIINTFLAILELLKKQFATAEQNVVGGNIILTHNAEADVIENAGENPKELLIDVEEYN